jgi:hypothetical protein
VRVAMRRKSQQNKHRQVPGWSIWKGTNEEAQKTQTMTMSPPRSLSCAEMRLADWLRRRRETQSHRARLERNFKFDKESSAVSTRRSRALVAAQSETNRNLAAYEPGGNQQREGLAAQLLRKSVCQGKKTNLDLRLDPDSALARLSVLALVPSSAHAGLLESVRVATAALVSSERRGTFLRTRRLFFDVPFFRGRKATFPPLDQSLFNPSNKHSTPVSTSTLSYSAQPYNPQPIPNVCQPFRS